MDIVNHTPFPALALEGADQHGQQFHVLVLRQTLTFASGALVYANEQAPLCESDAYFGASATGSVRQESDLCQYKPKCDVIVNATAYATKGNPTRLLAVRLVVKQADTAVPLPPRPQGMNQFMEPDPAQLRRWEQAVEFARRSTLPGKRLVDKRLWVYGEREFKKKLWLVRLAQWCVKWGTLTLLRPSAWTLTRARLFTTLPLRQEFAYGGQCRINGGDKAAGKVLPRDRLTPEQRAAGPDRAAAPAQQPIAHTVFDANPLGRGFAQGWAVKACASKAVPAPRIELPKEQLTAKQFSRWLAAPDAAARTARERLPLQNVAGFGVRPKSNPARGHLLGRVDAGFLDGDAPLPTDFNPAYWNAAPPDQQVAFLNGDEILELTNLCASESPGVTVDEYGNAILRLALPGHECFALLEVERAEAVHAAMRIDTVIIEPEEQRVTLVWRLVAAKLSELPVRMCELRMRSRDDGGGQQAAASAPAPAFGEDAR